MLSGLVRETMESQRLEDYAKRQAWIMGIAQGLVIIPDAPIIPRGLWITNEGEYVNDAED